MRKTAIPPETGGVFARLAILAESTFLPVVNFSIDAFVVER